jgi:hypothetical protein
MDCILKLKNGVNAIRPVLNLMTQRKKKLSHKNNNSDSEPSGQNRSFRLNQVMFRKESETKSQNSGDEKLLFEQIKIFKNYIYNHNLMPCYSTSALNPRYITHGLKNIQLDFSHDLKLFHRSRSIK